MRIEGRYTVPAPAEQVYAALMAPALLARAIPGCERLIQLGPADAEEGGTFEARVRAGVSVWVVVLRVRGGRQHNRVELSLRASSARSTYAGRGSITLVRHLGQTLLSYTLAVEGPERSASTTSPETALYEMARWCGNGLTAALTDPAAPDGSMRKGSGDVALEPGARAVSIGFQQIGQRAVWLAGGLLVGVAALALVSRLARRLASWE